ncbi:hypothetical protein M2326_003549 [Flavobacterium sp. 7A]|nr:hypothetical protein [Flavobacterium sp. 7A]
METGRTAPEKNNHPNKTALIKPIITLPILYAIIYQNKPIIYCMYFCNALYLQS